MKYMVLSDFTLDAKKYTHGDILPDVYAENQQLIDFLSSRCNIVACGDKTASKVTTHTKQKKNAAMPTPEGFRKFVMKKKREEALAKAKAEKAEKVIEEKSETSVSADEQ